MRAAARLIRMFRVTSLLAVLCFSATGFPRIPVSIGVKGGLALTDAFENTNLLYGDFYPYGEITIHNYSDSKDYIVGPFVDLRLPLGFGVEADALYRSLHLATVYEFAVGTPVPDLQRDNTWEFPILAKYRFKLPIARPYIDAGPSFRTSHSIYQTTLSSHGIAAGAGVDIKALLLHISPEIRYTHWASDSIYYPAASGPPHSNVNQVEFLVGIAF